jgi:hypothetical protein
MMLVDLEDRPEPEIDRLVRDSHGSGRTSVFLASLFAEPVVCASGRESEGDES